jgi:hypothetical protein
MNDSRFFRRAATLALVAVLAISTAVGQTQDSGSKGGSPSVPT